MTIKHLDLRDLPYHLDFRVYIIDIRVCFSDAHVLISAVYAMMSENIIAYTVVAQCCEQINAQAEKLKNNRFP